MQNSFLRAKFSPLAVCPPVELCLLMELFLLERGAMAHPQHTKRRNCWDPQVRASPTWHLCLVWPNARKHTGSCKSQKQSSLVCNITYTNKAQLANVGAAPQWQGFATSGVKVIDCPQLAVLLPATCMLLPCPKSESRIRTHSKECGNPFMF